MMSCKCTGCIAKNLANIEKCRCPGCVQQNFPKYSIKFFELIVDHLEDCKNNPNFKK